MLRTDGKYEIYTLEFNVKGEDKWHTLSFDAAWVTDELYKSKEKVWAEFSACGQCWQETGVHGTYDVEIAIKLYVLLKQHSLQKEKYMYRVTKKTIRQESEVLWCG
jgi:hypothetical protein